MPSSADCIFQSAPVDQTDFSTDENVKMLSTMVRCTVLSHFYPNTAPFQWSTSRWKKKTSKLKVACRFYRCASISDDSEDDDNVAETYKARRPDKMVIDPEVDLNVMPPPSPLPVASMRQEVELPPSPYATPADAVEYKPYSISERISELRSYWDYFLDLLSRLGIISIDDIEQRYISGTLSWHDSGILHHTKLQRLRTADKLLDAVEKQEFRLQKMLGIAKGTPKRRSPRKTGSPRRSKRSPKKKERGASFETDRRVEERRKRRSRREQQSHKKNLEGLTGTSQGIMIQWMLQAVNRRSGTPSAGPWGSIFEKSHVDCLYRAHRCLMKIHTILKQYNQLQLVKSLYFELTQRYKRDELRLRGRFENTTKILRQLTSRGDANDDLALAARNEAQHNLQDNLLAQETHRERYKSTFLDQLLVYVGNEIEECLYEAYNTYCEVYSYVDEMEYKETYSGTDYEIENLPALDLDSNNELVRALTDYTATSDKELSFYANDCLLVMSKDAGGWWYGECNGEYGWFPSDYVQQHYDLWSIAELDSARIDS